MPHNAEHELYQDDADTTAEWMEAAMDHVLSFSSVGVEQWLHGPDTHSADHSPIIGRVPGVENVFVSQASTPRKFNAVLRLV